MRAEIPQFLPPECGLGCAIYLDKEGNSPLTPSHPPSLRHCSVREAVIYLISEKPRLGGYGDWPFCPKILNSNNAKKFAFFWKIFKFGTQL